MSPQQRARKIEQLIQQVNRDCGPLTWLGPQSDESIRALAKALNVTLPPSYVAFLRKYGGGGLGIPSISGIMENDPLKDPLAPGSPYDSVYHDTLRLRDEGAPADYVVVAANWDEVVFVLDLSQRRKDGECPVMWLDPNDLEGGEHSASFADFFQSSLEDHLEARWP